MTNTLLRAGALGCALLATTALTGPAFAQTPPQLPVYQHVDANGVDLTDGSFHFSIVEGSVGAGAGALPLVTSWGTHRTDNFRRMLYRSDANPAGEVTVTIQIGGVRRTFTGQQSATSLASDQADGSVLTKVSAAEYLFREADGTVTNFTWPAGAAGLTVPEFCAANKANGCSLPAASTSAPNGAQLAYDWFVREGCWEEFEFSPEPVTRCAVYYRLASVMNNPGNSIAYVYADNNDFSPAPADWFRRVGSVLSAVGGGEAETSYDTSTPNVTQVTDMGDRIWRLTHDSSGRLTGIRRPGSSADNITIAYGANGVSSVTRDGVTTNYARTVSGSTATMVVTQVDGDANTADPQSTIVSNLAIGRPTSMTDPLGRATTISYTLGRPDTITAPEGNVVDYDYDARGNVVRTRFLAKPGSAEASQSAIETTATYAATCANPVTCNLPTSITDARGNVSDFTYDATHGGLLNATGPAAAPGGVRPQTRTTYTQVAGMHLPQTVSACRTAASCTGGSDEVRTSVVYNSDLSVQSVTSGAGDGSLSATTANAYDTIGNLVSVDGPLDGTDDTVRFRYDEARQRVGTISPDPDGTGALRPRAERTTYRPDGQVSRVEAGTLTAPTDALSTMVVAEQADIAFDANSRPVSSTLSAGTATLAVSETSYDGLGRPLCVAQRMDTSDWGVAAADACSQDPTPSATFGPDRIARIVRDAAGRVTEQRSAVGATGAVDPGVLDARTTYTPNGQVESVTDGELNHTFYTYDGHDRLKRTLFPMPTRASNAANVNDYEERTYDAAGNVVSFRNRANETTGFSYDALGRQTVIDRPGTELDTTYAYDLHGRMTRATTFYDITFAYDALGRQTGETNPHGTIASQYDKAGRRTRLTWPDSFYVTYDYLTTGEMTRIRENGATSGVGVLASFAYDDRGRRTSLTRGSGTVTSYAYDAASRLTSLAHNFGGNGNDVTFAMTYNPAGQILTRAGAHNAYAWNAPVGTREDTHNGLNQILTATGTSPISHDLRGNTTAIGTATFTYASDNRMTQGAGASLYYDPLDRLRFVQGGGNEQRVYDGGELIMELDANGTNLLRRYVHGPGTDEPLVWYEGAGTTDRRWLHADERGSIIGAFNSSGGGIGYAAYDEYGRRQVWGNLGRFGYTGQQWLPEIGMHYYRARIYDQDGGRFMQADPIGYGGGMNLYAYVGGDPVNQRDPMGTLPTENPTEDQLEADEKPITVTGRRLIGSFIGASTPLRVRVPFLLNFLDGTIDCPPTDGVCVYNPPIVVTAPRRLRQRTGRVSGHRYRVTSRICDGRTQTCHIERTNTQLCVLPGRLSTRPVRSGALYAVYDSAGDVMPGFVNSYRTGENSYRNVTTRFHLFQGTVDRSFTQTSDGSVYATTVGSGTATRPQDELNQSAGPAIFREQDRLCGELVGM